MNANQKELGEARHDAGGFDADANYLAQQENYIVGVVFTVGVGNFGEFSGICVHLRSSAGK